MFHFLHSYFSLISRRRLPSGVWADQGYKRPTPASGREQHRPPGVVEQLVQAASGASQVFPPISLTSVCVCPATYSSPPGTSARAPDLQAPGQTSSSTTQTLHILMWHESTGTETGDTDISARLLTQIVETQRLRLFTGILRPKFVLPQGLDPPLEPAGGGREFRKRAEAWAICSPGCAVSAV